MERQSAVLAREDGVDHAVALDQLDAFERIRDDTREELRRELSSTMAASTGTFAVKAGMAQMLKGGVIMDVVNVEQARIAEEAGACA